MLDFARHYPCQKCGAPDAVPAHYSGYLSHRLGKGTGQKTDDHCVVPLCTPCHTDFDSYQSGNMSERAAEFMALVLVYLGVLLRDGRLKIDAG